MARRRILGLSLYALLPFGGLLLPGDVEAAQTAIVSLAGSGEVAFIDLATAQVSASVKLVDRASFPLHVAITPDGSSMIVACDTGYVSFISSQGVVTKTLLDGPEQNGLTAILNQFAEVAVTPDGAMALVTEGNELGQLFRFDVATRELVGPPWMIGDDPSRIVMSPDGLTAYVTDILADEPVVHVVNLSDGTYTTESLLVDPAVESIGDFALVPPNGSRAIVTDPGGDRVLLMDTTTWQALDQQDPAPNRLAEPDVLTVSPDGSLAIVANSADQSVTFVTVSSGGLTIQERVRLPKV